VREVDDDKTPDETRQPPVASTSRVKLTPTRPESNVAVTTHETPVQVKNIAFRQGAGTPGTAGKSARRNSSGSARRGSSIGGGFTGKFPLFPSRFFLFLRKVESRRSRVLDADAGPSTTAMPHPEIDDKELWRSTDPLLPIAAQTRSIVSWATQRSRIKVFEGAKSTPERDLAKSVVDSFIDDICNLVVDTSVPRDAVSFFLRLEGGTMLTPFIYSSNEWILLNYCRIRPTFKMPRRGSHWKRSSERMFHSALDHLCWRCSLVRVFHSIEREQNTRQAITSTYAEFSTRRAAAREASSTSSLAQPIDPVALAETFDLSRPGPTSLEEALEMGRLLLEEAKAKKEEGEKAKKKDRRKSKAKEEDGEAALDLRVRETLDRVSCYCFSPIARLCSSCSLRYDVLKQTVSLGQLTHRLSGFTRVASRYISHRSAEVHQALTAYSLHGLESTTSSSTTNDPQAGGSSASPSGGAGLSGLVGVGASHISTGGLDPMDLLRAISRADSSRR